MLSHRLVDYKSRYNLIYTDVFFHRLVIISIIFTIYIKINNMNIIKHEILFNFFRIIDISN